MEGIVRKARTHNPYMDVIVLHFADLPHVKDYANARLLKLEDAQIFSGWKIMPNRASRPGRDIRTRRSWSPPNRARS